MKIAFYSHSIAPSIDGVCRRFTAILHELDRLGHETIMFSMEEDPQDLPSSTKAVALDYMMFPTYPDKKVAMPTIASMIAVLSTLSREKPDIIHIVSDGYSQLFSLAGLLLGIPVVGSFHTDIIDLLTTHGAYEAQKMLIYIKEGLDSLVLDSCATTSSSFQKKLAGQGVKCEHILITSVDVKNFSAQKKNSALRKELMFGAEDGFLCVYVGRISNEKRMDVIIDATRDLAGTDDTYIALIGDGPSAPYYAKAHSKENRIYCKPRFLNHKELAEVYASSDIHVSASEFETLGNTVLEAFAVGLPVVVPRTQGFRDTVRHGVDGFLFNPGDRADARRYIQQLKDDPKMRVKMGAAGRESVQKKTIEYVVKDLKHWYTHGAKVRDARSTLNCFCCAALLFCTVLVTVFMFVVYNILGNYLLKPFIKNSQYAATAPKALQQAKSVGGPSSTDNSKPLHKTNGHKLD